MKRWLVLMAALMAMMAIASAKRVYYPHRWDDPLEARPEAVVLPMP
jgi:hypothetical protein